EEGKDDEALKLAITLNLGSDSLTAKS
ncbi:unnamed protein product, partial [Allacma fusca]